MKAVSIIILSIYICTVVYNLLATLAATARIKRYVKVRNPELVGMRIKHTFAEILVAIMPYFVPILHNFLAVAYMFHNDEVVEKAYEKYVIMLKCEGSPKNGTSR